VKTCVIAMAMLMFLSPAFFGMQAPVPEIPFDSVPNFFKLPPDLHLGEASGVAVNRRDTSSYTVAAIQLDRRMERLRRRSWNLPLTVSISARSVATFTHGRLLTRSAWTKTTTFGRSIKVPTWSSSSILKAVS